MISDPGTLAMIQAKSKEEFASGFLAMQSLYPPPGSVVDRDFDDYVKMTGEALHDRMLNSKRKRRRPSDVKRGFQNESALFRNRTDWRQRNLVLADYFADMFADLANDLPNGTAGNRKGAARTFERFYVDRAVDAWNENVCIMGHPEWHNAILKPGFRPNDMSSRSGEASYERSVLERMVLAAAVACEQKLDPSKVRLAIRSRAKYDKAHKKMSRRA